MPGSSPRWPSPWAIELQRRLGIANIADLEPNQLYYAMFASHPSITARIATARDWAEVNRVALP